VAGLVVEGAPGGQGGFDGQRGNAQPAEATDAKLDEVKVESTVIVWGVRNGERITASVVYIQFAGR
jgi:hypothetical protein